MRVGQQAVGFPAANTVESQQPENSRLPRFRGSVRLVSVPDKRKPSWVKADRSAKLYFSAVLQLRKMKNTNKEVPEYYTVTIRGKIRGRATVTNESYAAGRVGLEGTLKQVSRKAQNIQKRLEKLDCERTPKVERRIAEGRSPVSKLDYVLGAFELAKQCIKLTYFCSKVKLVFSTTSEHPGFKVAAGKAQLAFAFEGNQRQRAGQPDVGPRFRLTRAEEITADRGKGSRTTSLSLTAKAGWQLSSTEMSHAELMELNQEELRDAANDCIERFRQTGDTDMAAKALHCIQAIADDEQAVEMQKSLKQAMTEINQKELRDVELAKRRYAELAKMSHAELTKMNQGELRDAANYYIERIRDTRNINTAKKANKLVNAMGNTPEGMELRKKVAVTAWRYT